MLSVSNLCHPQYTKDFPNTHQCYMKVTKYSSNGALQHHMVRVGIRTHSTYYLLHNVIHKKNVVEDQSHK